MSHRKAADLLSGIFFAALGVFVYAQGAAMPAVKRGLGPGGYPKFIATGLVLLGVILAAQYFFKPKAPAVPAADSAAKAAKAKSALLRAFAFALMCFVYSQLIFPLGFVPASVLFLFAAIHFAGYRNRVTAALTAVLLPVAAYLLFRHVFLVLIPTGTIFR